MVVGSSLPEADPVSRFAGETQSLPVTFTLLSGSGVVGRRVRTEALGG